MVSATRRSESREQAIARLAQKARESGVAIRRDRTGRYFVSSASQRGSWHYCTAVSCDCRGFASHGRCMHHSLLLVHLGWADEDPTPERAGGESAPPAQAKTPFLTPERSGVRIRIPEQAKTSCHFCHGQGSTPSTELFGGRRVDICVTCWHCRGSGEQRAA